MERALESKAAPMQSSGFEGNLPTTLRGLAPGRYVYSVSGEEHLVEPTRYEPHSRRLSDGRILSDPTAVSHRRATIPFDVRPGEVTEVELRAVLTCIVRGSLPSTGSAENSHANVHLRHQETRSGERRVDLEAALVGRFGTFELVDLRPGTKVLSATVRTGDRVTWLSVPPFELLPGETRDVGELEPGGAQLTVLVNLVALDGADPRESEGKRTITLLSGSPGQTFVNRAVEFDGRQGTALFDGLPKGYYTVYVDLTPPAAGRSYRDPPPYQQSVTIGGPGSSESVVFDFVETASRVAGAYVQLYSEIDPSDAESAYGGYRTSHGRGSTASLPECVPAGEGWHYLLPVHDGDVHFAAAIIERGEHGRAEYFEGFAPDVTSGAVLGPYRAVPSTSVTLALPGDATPPSALDLKPPSHERWTQLSVEVVFEKDVSGAWTSSPMSLPIDWHVRATRSAGPTWTVIPSPTPIEAAPR